MSLKVNEKVSSRDYLLRTGEEEKSFFPCLTFFVSLPNPEMKLKPSAFF